MAAELVFLGVAVTAFCALLGMRLHTRWLMWRRNVVPAVFRVVRPFAPCVPVAEALDAYGGLARVQLEPLQLLGMAGTRGLPVSMFNSCFERSLESFPEIYEGSSFDQWLAYYTAAQLLSISGRRAYLAPEGRRLLKLRDVSRTPSQAA